MSPTEMRYPAARVEHGMKEAGQAWIQRMVDTYPAELGG